MESENDILIDKVESSSGWRYINIYGECWIYHNGEYVKQVECALLASLYNDAKAIYLHGEV